MVIHSDVASTVNGRVLRDVIQIHGMEVPYPAELWVDGRVKYRNGTAMFSIGDGGYLTAEYFGYDGTGGTEPLEWMGLGLKRLDVKLIMKGTGVEIPVWWISSSPKARTWHSVPMPSVTAYICQIQGRLGDADSEMKSVSMTIAGLPDIHLGQRTTRIPEESTSVENLMLRGFKKQTGVLSLEAGEWHIELTGSYVDDEGRWPLHHLTLARADRSPFRLPHDIDNSIINAVRRFLSFQCGRWVDVPTIVCNPVFSTATKHLVLREGETDEEILGELRKFRVSEEPLDLDELNVSLQNVRGFEDVSGADLSAISFTGEQATMTFARGDPTAKLAWVGRLFPRDRSGESAWTAAETWAWPSMFNEFWNRYNEPENREHLGNAVYHYIASQQDFDYGSIGQALVAAQSTLQALTRWWNGLDTSYRFGRRNGPTFDQWLVKAIRKAELGKDSGVVVDEERLCAKVEEASRYRNDIDHGRGGRIEGHGQQVVDCWTHHQNLARLLVLAKLGNRNRDARGCMAGPVFLKHED